jgi:hypothetical protein
MILDSVEKVGDPRVEQRFPAGDENLLRPDSLDNLYIKVVDFIGNA